MVECLSKIRGHYFGLSNCPEGAEPLRDNSEDQNNNGVISKLIDENSCIHIHN